MKFIHVTIMVKDMKESLEFYENIVGLPIAEKFNAGPKQEIVFLGDGDALVELLYNSDMKEPNIGQDISIGFKVASLDETMDFMKEKGIEIYSGPFQPNESTRFFFVLDPNGVKVQFIEQ